VVPNQVREWFQNGDGSTQNFTVRACISIGFEENADLGTGIMLALENLVRTQRIGHQQILRTALIAGYILAVLLFSGLARADVRLLDVALPILGSK
jgi:hypothetical protein